MIKRENNGSVRFSTLHVDHNDKKKLTNFSEAGNSNSFTKPKSSPVASERPLDERLAQLTSALSALRGQTPMTSLPRTLKRPQIRIRKKSF